MPGGGFPSQIDEVVLVAGQSSYFCINSDLHLCESNEEDPHSEHLNILTRLCLKPSLI